MTFIVGFFVGGVVGVILVALCVINERDDDEQISNRD